MQATSTPPPLSSPPPSPRDHAPPPPPPPPPGGGWTWGGGGGGREALPRECLTGAVMTRAGDEGPMGLKECISFRNIRE